MAPSPERRVRHNDGHLGRTGKDDSPHKNQSPSKSNLRRRLDPDGDVDMESDGEQSEAVQQEDPNAQLIQTESVSKTAKPAKPIKEFLNPEISHEHLFARYETVDGKNKEKGTPASIGTENNGKDEVLFLKIEELKLELKEFAKLAPQIPASKQAGFTERLLKNDDDNDNVEELVRYVGCLVLGNTKEDWNDLLTGKESREAIILGVVARALKEHVFGEYLFGGDKSINRAMMEIDTNGKHHEGFERTRERAGLMNKYKLQDGELQAQIETVRDQLSKLLAPLWSADLKPVAKKQLTSIIKLAAKIAELIRKAPDVVYYWPPAFKDEEFEPARMEAYNLEQMIENSPYDKRKVGGYHRAVLKDPKSANTEAIVRIVAFPAIVAYRQYGGKLAVAELRAEEAADHQPLTAPELRQPRDRYNNLITPKQGFRSRLINKSVVHLAWGQQRLLTKEAGTSAHLDAVRDNKTATRYKDSGEIIELTTWYDNVKPSK